MVSIKTDLSGVNQGDTICSVWSRKDKKWVRILKDKDGNNINIYKLEVERSLKGSDKWILCLYKSYFPKYIFYLDDNLKFKIWKKSAFEM